jgi:hypothetical protein
LEPANLIELELIKWCDTRELGWRERGERSLGKREEKIEGGRREERHAIGVHLMLLGDLLFWELNRSF